MARISKPLAVILSDRPRQNFFFFFFLNRCMTSIRWRKWLTGTVNHCNRSATRMSVLRPHTHTQTHTRARAHAHARHTHSLWFLFENQSNGIKASSNGESSWKLWSCKVWKSPTGWRLRKPQCEGSCDSSAQDDIYALGKVHNYALHPVSQKFPQRCLWNGSSVRLRQTLRPTNTTHSCYRIWVTFHDYRNWVTFSNRRNPALPVKKKKKKIFAAEGPPTCHTHTGPWFFLSSQGLDGCFEPSQPHRVISGLTLDTVFTTGKRRQEKGARAKVTAWPGIRLHNLSVLCQIPGRSATPSPLHKAEPLTATTRPKPQRKESLFQRRTLFCFESKRFSKAWPDRLLLLHVQSDLPQRAEAAL